MKNDIEKCL
jgi:ABC-type transporter Mla subunit MlaD